ncbi:hypothetical protein QQ045_016624 [Rhodiola kirilowii]
MDENYKNAIKENPGSGLILGNYAGFLKENCYVLGSYARFMWDAEEDDEEEDEEEEESGSGREHGGGGLICGCGVEMAKLMKSFALLPPLAASS